MIHYLFLALLPASFALSVPPKYKVGIRKPNGSKDCPANYIPVTNYYECRSIAAGDCLSDSKTECALWSRRLKNSNFKSISQTVNQPGCYYDQGDGVLFNTNRDFKGTHNEKDDRPICKWVRGVTEFEFVKKGTCESAGFHSIYNQQQCKDAATVFGQSKEYGISDNYNFSFNVGDFGKNKPTGCSWMSAGDKLELFEFSTGECSAGGYGGCFCTNSDFYTTGILKLSGSNTCPPYYVQVKDVNECQKVALGKCLTKDTVECDVWTKWVLTSTFAANHGVNNQPGCSFDENSGVIFNTNTNWSGKFNENDDRPICKKDSETFGESKIIKMLRALIAEARKEIVDIQSAVVVAQKDVNAKKTEFLDAKRKEIEAKSALDDAQRVLSTAKGVLSSSQEQYSQTAPGLRTEIVLFKRVIGMLKNLTSGQELVEKNKVTVSAFISLADQANPDKINEVIGLLQKLIDTASAELVDLEKAVSRATAAVKKAQTAFYDAEGEWKSASSVRQRKETSFIQAQGVLDKAKKHAADRIPVLDGEIESIEEAITLIKSLEE